MSKIVFLLGIILLHIFADFNLQGWMASAKQKDYWKKELKLEEKQFQNSMYKYDYKCVLLIHCIQWALHIMIPVLLYSYIVLNECNIFMFLFVTVWNVVFHYIVDDAKANQFKFNLVDDQLCHLLQIVLTWVMFV